MSRVFLFLKDFTEQGDDRFFWLVHDELQSATAEEITSYAGMIICHDFWLIRDILLDRTGNLPVAIVDLDEFRISTSGNPDDRKSRETADITRELRQRGLSEETCEAYRKMFNRALEFDEGTGLLVANAMLAMYQSLCESARETGEYARFFEVEVPIYGVLQKAMGRGIPLDTSNLSAIRKDAEYEYFSCLKDYSAKHDMPLETPSDTDIEMRLIEDGFDFSGVSTEYLLEFLPHTKDFGPDTIELRNLDAARRVLSSLTLSTDRMRPILDVFGSRTSRVHLRSPSLQNIPKKYRSIITARVGKQLCYIDFDQFEVGIMAALSGDLELKELYAAGDMYDLFAREHLGLPENRKAAKRLFLSYAYGMSRKALVDAAESLGASRSNAKKAFQRFSQYENWKKSIEDTFLKDNSVATMMGNHFKRKVSGRLSAKERRSVVSQVVQGTASLIFKKVILAVSELQDVTILLPMHDALLFEHQSQHTPALVVETFERVMTAQLCGRIHGKASLSQFTAN